jgi:hypothetical protein
MNFVLAAWRWVSSPRSLFFLLPAFMLVLIVGTLAQKNMGLFPATKIFFHSWPALTILFLITLNTVAHFITQTRWEKKQLGTILVHWGVILLLIGGAFSLVMKREGFVVLRHGLPTATMIDYHDRVLTLMKDNQTAQILLHTELSENLELWPGVRIRQIIRNAQPAEKSATEKNAKCLGLACEYKLTALEAKLDDEANQMGLVLDVDGREAFVTEFMNPSLDLPSEKDSISIFFQRVTNPLPFELTLNRFEQTTWPGSDTAKSYRSEMTLLSEGVRNPATVEMNSPLRHLHYTLYQASVLNLPNGETASVLNVVYNPAWLFPYAASLLLFLGFALHMIGRRNA